jgi:mRNA interferase MazF
MIICERGDIVLVPFPFSSQSIFKKRPAVIISSNIYNNISPDVVIMAVTSQTGKTVGIGQCVITEWQGAGLLKPSSIKAAISTINHSLILMRLGKLSKNDILSMENSLKEFLDLK